MEFIWSFETFSSQLAFGIVSYARTTIIHGYFIAITFAGPLERYLNTRPSDLVFKQLPRDPANVNAWKTMGDPYIVLRFGPCHYNSATPGEMQTKHSGFVGDPTNVTSGGSVLSGNATHWLRRRPNKYYIWRQCWEWTCNCYYRRSQSPVVQSVVSLTSSLVVKMLTILVSKISNSQVFCWKKMWVAFANAKATHIFQQKYELICHS